MILGLSTLSPLTESLLKEQLQFLYGLVFFPSPDLLEEALQKGQVGVALWQRHRLLHVRSAEECRDFHLPVSLLMLLSFLEKALLQAPYQFGPYRFDPYQRFLKRKGTKGILLREKESEILLYLLKAPQMCASRQDLLGAIWGIQPGIETRTLETHIYQLRQKIKNDLLEMGEEKDLILNTDQGYCLSEDIETPSFMPLIPLGKTVTGTDF
jgi:DNA-binding winged helix-turn-helix (wHTH) protein